MKVINELYIIEINSKIDQKDFDILLKKVDEDRAAEILRYKFRDDAQRALIGSLLARYAICKKTGSSNGMLAFGKTEFGKPVLLNYENLHFNISHSGKWVLCGLSSERIGVDAEIIRPVNLSFTGKFFTTEEKNYLINDHQTRLASFYKIWTLKESYIKAIGKGFYIPLNSFSVIKNGELDLSAEGFYFISGFLSDTAVYAVCSSVNNTVTYVHISIDELIGGLF